MSTLKLINRFNKKVKFKQIFGFRLYFRFFLIINKNPFFSCLKNQYSKLVCALFIVNKQIDGMACFRPHSKI